MSIAEHQDVPAAWYPDRANPEQLRWWDGTDWTDEVRPLIAAVPEPVEVVEEAPKFQAPPLLQTRRGINVVAQPAEGFGHASPEQLRAWPPPHAEDRSEIPTPVSEFPSEWRRGARRSAEPAEYVTQEPAEYFTVEPAAIVRDELPAEYFPAPVEEAPVEAAASGETYGTVQYVAHEEQTAPVEDLSTLWATSNESWQQPIPDFPVPAHHDPVTAEQQLAEPFAAQPFYQEQFTMPEQLRQFPTPAQFAEPADIDPRWPAPSFAQEGLDSFYPQAAAPVTTPPGHTTLTRRQLRAMVGPLTTRAAATN